MTLTEQWTITWTFLVIGLGFGMLASAVAIDVSGRPRGLYVAGTVIALAAGAAYLFEMYLFFIPK